MLSLIMDMCKNEKHLKDWAKKNKSELQKIPPKELEYFRFLYRKKLKELRDVGKSEQG